MTFDHLRRRLEISVHAVECIENHIAVISADIGGGGDGIERDQILLRNKAQNPRALGLGKGGGGDGGEHSCPGQAGKLAAGNHLMISFPGLGRGRSANAADRMRDACAPRPRRQAQGPRHRFVTSFPVRFRPKHSLAGGIARSLAGLRAGFRGLTPV